MKSQIRFRGNAILVSDGFIWQAQLIMDGEEDTDLLQSLTSFKTREEAVQDMKNAFHNALTEVASKHPDVPVDLNIYYDMNQKCERKFKEN